MHFDYPRQFIANPLLFYAAVAIPEVIFHGLSYSEEDVSASQDRILLHSTSDDLSQRPGAIKLLDSSKTWMLHDVVPSLYQQYKDRHQPHRLYTLENKFGVVTHCSFVIFRHRFPYFSPRMIAKVIQHNNNPAELHGPVARTQGQWVEWLNVADMRNASVKGDDDRANDWWLNFLARSDRPAEEIIEDAWMGPGNMWVFVRPDRFPIAEALTFARLQCFAPPVTVSETCTTLSLHTLPLDIIQEISSHLPVSAVLRLIQITKLLRALVLPHLDAFIHTSLELHNRYLLPETPSSSAYRSHEELDWWTTRWAEGGIIGDGDSIPWTAYARACARSRSMRSRKRIWDIVGDMEAVARKDGVLTGFDDDECTNPPV
ncbi:hypothetical protein FB45DRAFT_927193 [Roridomyces roridus]|uniref:F-box domain-containing protein n=1 Tax=Roridomyces roridus TaxID=1738132 RepID=A0AAD7BII5_9AGAR|nr:hypothetical protein FB45DRAFT_927193 [Roridomyces roridus]